VPSGTFYDGASSKQTGSNERTLSADEQKVHTCAFSFAILFILYYTSNLHQRNPVVPDAPINDSDLLPPNANDMKFTETQELVAEFFSIILILFGDGVAAMVVLFGKNLSQRFTA
jgi:hypothetical protein